MNKRIVEFINGLIEENDRLEQRLSNAIFIKEKWITEVEQQRKQIAELKKKIRKLNTELNKEKHN